MIHDLGGGFAKQRQENLVMGLSVLVGYERGKNSRVLRGGNLWGGVWRLLLGVVKDVFGRFDWSTCMGWDGACGSCKHAGDTRIVIWGKFFDHVGFREGKLGIPYGALTW